MSKVKRKQKFDGYIELETGGTMNKDVTRKLIEQAIKEEQSKAKPFNLSHIWLIIIIKLMSNSSSPQGSDPLDKLSSTYNKVLDNFFKLDVFQQ